MKGVGRRPSIAASLRRLKLAGEGASAPTDDQMTRVSWVNGSAGLKLDDLPVLVDPDAALVEKFQAASRAAFERSVAEGRHVSTNPVAKPRLVRANAARIAEAMAWERDHPEPPDPEVFRREILPGLQGVTLGKLATATGLSNA